MALSGVVHQQIAGLVSQNPVVLFMKGTRQMPQCGFSAQVVRILDELLPEYETVDVLRDPNIRDGIKQYSEWPTIPQLYVNGKFIGGCDIVRDMNESGELQTLLGKQLKPSAGAAALPTITVSSSAQAALARASAEAVDTGQAEPLHLLVTAQFEHDLYFGPRTGNDIDVPTNGPTLLLDRSSTGRANGLRIDFVEGENGGFKIVNPNEPRRVKQITAPEVKAMLDRKEVQLFDVRPEAERRLASIPAARALDAA
ncbi:MAG TPA: Grx4 family monothiol glutaredoxin, partial [Polyangiaceae bacterium]